MGAESNGIVPEHPCKSKTDGFLSVRLDLVGKSFTLKRRMGKVCIEFAKRRSSFFYFSAAHDQLYEGEA